MLSLFLPTLFWMKGKLHDPTVIPILNTTGETHWIYFLQVPYHENCWYWELVRLFRGVCLGLPFIIPEFESGAIVIVFVLAIYTASVFVLRPHKDFVINTIDGLVCGVACSIFVFGLMNKNGLTSTSYVVLVIITITVTYLAGLVVLKLIDLFKQGKYKEKFKMSLGLNTNTAINDSNQQQPLIRQTIHYRTDFGSITHDEIK